MYRYLILTCVLLATSVTAQNWVFLGQRKVNRSMEKDTIRVEKQEGVFRKIQIRIKNKPVRIADLKVYFRNGSVYDVSVQKDFRAGQSSRIIDLPGDDRMISHVTVKYKTKALRKATLELWGIKKVASSQPSIQPVKTTPVTVWDHLGSKYVGYGKDHDEIMVTSKEGLFRAVRLQVKEAGIFLRSYRIVFANGEQVKGTVNTAISRGSYTPTLDLPGANRVIKKVILNYTSINNNRQKARVHLWGKKVVGSSATKPATPKKDLTAKWRLLGKRQVNLALEVDTIRAEGKKQYAKQIKIKVFNKPIQVLDLKVFFENGTFADLPIRENIPAGGATNVKDLPGQVRKIDRVQIIYKTRKRFKLTKQKATIEVWAK